MPGSHFRAETTSGTHVASPGDVGGIGVRTVGIVASVKSNRTVGLVSTLSDSPSWSSSQYLIISHHCVIFYSGVINFYSSMLLYTCIFCSILFVQAL